MLCLCLCLNGGIGGIVTYNMTKVVDPLRLDVTIAVNVEHSNVEVLIKLASQRYSDRTRGSF